jgi:hypothetical protein
MAMPAMSVMSRGGEAMAVKRPARSAGYIGWGLLLMVAGWVAAVAGLLNPSGRAFGPDEMSPWVSVGAAGTLLGFAILAIGIHTLAQAVDAIAATMHTTASPPQTPGPAAQPESD